MSVVRRTLAASLLLVLAGGCRRSAAPAAGGGGADEAARLLEQGRYDDAIARVGEAGDAESLYLLGRAWAGKARTAPEPATDPAAAEPQPFKPEELQALSFLERALSARPDHAGANLAIAELLAPHAVARAEAQRSRRPGPPAGGPDASAERVLRAFGAAMQADAAGTAAAEGLVKFATALGRTAEADAGYRELLQRRREDPDLLVRYGDFLAGAKRDPQAAVAQYGQALMWRPDDAATRSKIVEIELAAAAELLQRRQWAMADARLAEARKAGIDAGSPQAARARELEQALREVRGR